MTMKENKKTLNIIKKLSQVLLVILTAIIIVVYVSGLIGIPKYGFFDSTVQNFTEEWTYEKLDGSSEVFTMPANYAPNR